MQPRLYVSFWDIQLSNLPVGSFRRRILSTAEARSVIRSARASGTLLCVAKEDLGAPYCEGARERHRELCAALREYGDIEIELKDFFGEACANPLCFAEIGEHQSLLVVECRYSFDPAQRRDASNRPGEAAEARVRRRVKEEALNMKVLPDSIEFYAFEQVVAAA